MLLITLHVESLRQENVLSRLITARLLDTRWDTIPHNKIKVLFLFLAQGDDKNSVSESEMKTLACLF